MNKSTGMRFEITPPGPPNEGILFVDHSGEGRSGHLGHALVEYAPGKILAFYPNCSAENKGHNGDGWMEYKRSEDGGVSWSEPRVLGYSKAVYEDEGDCSVMCEKAVAAPGGDIILFNLECMGKKWEPLGIPTFMRSSDGGRSWSRPSPLGEEPGRVYDALVHEGVIYALELCNDSRTAWYANKPEHHYSLYASTDGGKTFSLRGMPPFDISGRGYGAMSVLPGGLIIYVYNIGGEKNLDYVLTEDGGRSWSPVRTAHFARQIRNPQMAAFKGGWVMHGRSGSRGGEAEKGHFVLYCSGDGINWDDGRYLKMREAGSGAYSNNLLVRGPEGGPPRRLLIQASHAYEESMTNVYHWWLE